MAEMNRKRSIKGSGPVSCCGGHRSRCLFGRMHSWFQWFEQGRLVRTAETHRCVDCGGVCTAEEQGTERTEPCA